MHGFYFVVIRVYFMVGRIWLVLPGRERPRKMTSRLQIPDPTAVNNQIVVTFKLNEASRELGKPCWTWQG